MKVEVIRDPVFCLILRDFFSKKISNEILEEAISNKEHFQLAPVNKGFDESWRNNLRCLYDNLYKEKRDESKLLMSVSNKIIYSEEFISILLSCPSPICELGLVNYHELQVSRYGDNQHYIYHRDRNDKAGRLITIIYYFFKEPKAWSGGELCITNSVENKGKLLEENPNIKKIIPEHNMAVIFDKQVLHCVAETHAPEQFDQGRFSANIWLGRRA